MLCIQSGGCSCHRKHDVMGLRRTALQQPIRSLIRSLISAHKNINKANIQIRRHKRTIKRNVHLIPAMSVYQGHTNNTENLVITTVPSRVKNLKMTVNVQIQR